MDKYNEALERAKKWEREHPHGYVIKDMMEYIFPELRESEDERIRKDIVAAVEMYGDLTQGRKSEIYAYLEKQKEHQNNSDAQEKALGRDLTFPQDKDKNLDEIAQDYVDGVKEYNPEPTWDLIQTAVCYGYHYREQKEQKPNSTEDMYIADEHFYERTPADSFKYKLAEYMAKNYRKAEGPYGHTYLISAETILKMAGEELLKRGVVQKPAEWSEEDEYRREGVVEWLRDHQKTIDRNSNNQAYESIESLISWLKSLSPQLSDEEIKKIRSEEYTKGFNDAAFGGQLKEWGAEDEDRIRQIERIAQQAGCTQKLQEEIHDWLKSLRSSWKPSEVCYGAKGDPDPAGVWIPSEEQMSMLRAIVNDPNNVGAESCRLAMQSLYNDLLKLKGGVAPMKEIDE